MNPTSDNSEIDPKKARAHFNRARFAALTNEEKIKKAQTFDNDRILRAASSIGEYIFASADGDIVNTKTGVTYTAEDVKRWAELPGTVFFMGCTCDDEQMRLRPMREVMADAGCGTPCFCKHHYMRLLFTGAKLRTTTGIRVSLKPKFFR